MNLSETASLLKQVILLSREKGEEEADAIRHQLTRALHPTMVQEVVQQLTCH